MIMTFFGRSISRFLSLFLLFGCVLAFMPGKADAQQLISEIRVQGAERVEPATVLSYLELKVGDVMTPESLDASLKRLFSTGLFADVALRQQGSELVVTVIENPIINDIAFEGNNEIESDQLLAEIQLRPRQVFTRTKVQSDVSRLYQVYRRNGRFSVNIEPKVIKLDQNRVNLVFEVQEGGVTTVKSIRFVGNKKFSDDRLRDEITTKEYRFYRFLSVDDRYDPDRLAYDQELLRKFYLSQGYADFNLLSASAELSNDRQNFFITFNVEEGQKYSINEINIDSRLKNFDGEVLRPHVTFEVGDTYNADEIQNSIDQITDALGDLQYAFVSVRPDIDVDRDAAAIGVTFQVNETPRVFVERIDVQGNVRTLDKVVRREILLAEGDPFNRTKLNRSEQKIKNLDYFETVEVNIEPGSAPDKSVVNVDVTEKSTGELSIGAGFSTSEGPLADFRIRERNFLGKGQDLLFATTIAGERSEFNIGFTEPYFFGRDLSAGFNVFHITRDLQDESSFDQRRTGASFDLGYPLSEHWRQSLRYRAERNDITDVQSDASLFIQGQEGQRDTSAISQRLVYDTRDSSISPSSGMNAWFDTEVAGLGGDAQYVSGRVGGAYYHSIFDNVVFSILGETGAIEGYSGDNVNINERFFLGGRNLRGFERAGIGPRDQNSDDSLGGEFFYRGSAELSFPMGLPEEYGILGHAFTDMGSLTSIDNEDDFANNANVIVLDDSSVRASVGLGMSWRSPFGPVRADFAFPIASEDYDNEERFRFDFGTRF